MGESKATAKLSPIFSLFQTIIALPSHPHYLKFFAQLNR